MSVTKNVIIYYGMSGALKGTTIGALHSGSKVMYSAIKTWKNYEEIIKSSGYSSGNLPYALLHLCRLSDHVSLGGDELIVERGVSDMLFYHEEAQVAMINIIQPPCFRDLFPTDTNYLKLLDSEKEILEGIGVTKKLVVQLDREFIETRVLTEPTRRAHFSSVDAYLEAQEKYVSFTKYYNDISETIEVTDAKEYLESIGVKYTNI